MTQREIITKQAKIITCNTNLSHAYTPTRRKTHISSSGTCQAGWKDTHIFEGVSRYLHRWGTGSTRDTSWVDGSWQAMCCHVQVHKSCFTVGLTTISTMLCWWELHCFQMQYSFSHVISGLPTPGSVVKCPKPVPTLITRSSEYWDRYAQQLNKFLFERWALKFMPNQLPKTMFWNN